MTDATTVAWRATWGSSDPECLRPAGAYGRMDLDLSLVGRRAAGDDAVPANERLERRGLHPLIGSTGWTS